MPTIDRVRMVAAAALAVLVVTAAPESIRAQQPADRTLVVGTKEVAPFAMRQADGSWSGISVDLWEHIADELGFTFEWRETDLPGLLAGIESGAFDAGVAAVTITPEREAVMDFTHPFHVSGLGIAVDANRRAGWFAVLEQFFSFQFLQIVAGLTALLFVVGGLVWLFERRANPDQFGGPAPRGLGSGFWWSAVTMTTVGYGDKAPATVGGRVVALLWMFTALIVISSFTASITASLTVGSLNTGIEGPDDLSSARVGSVAASTSTAYLDREGLSYAEAATPIEALTALAAGDVGAVVYDAAILRYEVRQGFSGRLVALPVEFEQQMYAIALPAGSALREAINRVLLARTADAEWGAEMARYLGTR
jgi:ABC-type amino acid transport substrate-binding protein